MRPSVLYFCGLITVGMIFLRKQFTHTTTHFLRVINEVDMPIQITVSRVHDNNPSIDASIDVAVVANSTQTIQLGGNYKTTSETGANTIDQESPKVIAPSAPEKDLRSSEPDSPSAPNNTLPAIVSDAVEKTPDPPEKMMTSNKPDTSVTATPASINATPAVTNHNQTEIPKRFHFVFLSPGFPDEQPPVPEHVQKNIQGWADLHPDYMVTVWNNTLFKTEFPELAKFVRDASTMAMVADLLRYHALEKYGGIYLDTDIAPIRSLEYLRANFQPVFGSCMRTKPVRPGIIQAPIPNSLEEYLIPNNPLNPKKPRVQRKCKEFYNSVIGTVPHHAALTWSKEHALQNVRERMYQQNTTDPSFSLKLTGPPLWGQATYAHPEVKILAVALFHPCGYFARKTCNTLSYKNQPHVFGMHEWKGSWKKGNKGLDNDTQKKK